jgi:hypothetical protein
MLVRTEHRVIAAATAAFVAGALVYPYRDWSGQSGGRFLESYPAFAHALFFTLLWAFPFRSLRSAITGAALILGLITMFELIQNQHIFAQIAPWLPEGIADYGRVGIYDPQDIAAGACGVIFATFVAVLVMRKKRRGYE